MWPRRRCDQGATGKVWSSPVQNGLRLTLCFGEVVVQFSSSSFPGAPGGIHAPTTNVLVLNNFENDDVLCKFSMPKVVQLYHDMESAISRSISLKGTTRSNRRVWDFKEKQTYLKSSDKEC